mmetsp:Transcript_87603/g.169740  ORF Transcript_87603/g.169740 Transcript_87603/m.169740 type:complete len:222 (-) Transcript_87603:406-1071(-)
MASHRRPAQIHRSHHQSHLGGYHNEIPFYYHNCCWLEKQSSVQHHAFPVLQAPTESFQNAPYFLSFPPFHFHRPQGTDCSKPRSLRRRRAEKLSGVPGTQDLTEPHPGLTTMTTATATTMTKSTTKMTRFHPPYHVSRAEIEAKLALLLRRPRRRKTHGAAVRLQRTLTKKNRHRQSQKTSSSLYARYLDARHHRSKGRCFQCLSVTLQNSWRRRRLHPWG